MSQAQALFTVLRQSTDAECASVIERLICSAPDYQLSRINVLDFAKRHDLGEEKMIAAFLHAVRIGLFELSWNVLCPGCGGVLGANATLKSVRANEYNCALCAAGYEPTLDEMVDVTFTVSPRVRRIAAHDPDTLPHWEYYRQIFWGSGVDLPQRELESAVERMTLGFVELPPGEKAHLSLMLPTEFLIVFEPVTHAAQFIRVKGEPVTESQSLTLVYTDLRAPTGTMELRPGPLRLLLENRTDRRVLPGVWVANDVMHEFIGKRRPFLTAKDLLSNQTFRDIYRTDTIDLNQRLKIISLTFMFTDLKGSTELYERVGDLVAFDLVREHFRVLNESVGIEGGAVVKTIGDAVMATFATPDRALAAALRIREAMWSLNAAQGREDLLLKIGIHEGPCLAVNLNDRQDYFGQTVNIASRVQRLALSQSILATAPVIDYPESINVLGEYHQPSVLRHTLHGMGSEVAVYEIP
jgi:class 3 adenylate cyclase